MSTLLRVFFDPDTIPGTTPTILSVTAVGQNRLDIVWTVSIDTGGSGLAGYDLLIDGVSVQQLGIQTSYSHTGLVALSAHTYRVRSRDTAGNLSSYSAQVSGQAAAAPAAFNPPFPRPSAYALSSLQNYANSAVMAELARRVFVVLGLFPGWQQSKGGGVSPTTVCQTIRSLSTVGTKLFGYVFYTDLTDNNETAPASYYEVFQRASNGGYAYTNGLSEATPAGSAYSNPGKKLNFTQGARIVDGKNLVQWYIDWAKGWLFDGATVSLGAGQTRSHAANPLLDGMFFDSVLQAERSPFGDFNCDGIVDTPTTAVATRTYNQTGHALALAYYRTVCPGKPCLVNSGEWYNYELQTGALISTTPLANIAEGGVIEFVFGQTYSYETTNNFAAAMRSIAVQVGAYRSEKWAFLEAEIPTVSSYALMRYCLGMALLNGIGHYIHAAPNYASENLPNERWDEEFFNLGYPTTPVPTAPQYFIEAGGTGGGVWRRDFDNGIVLEGARRGSGLASNFDQTTPYGSVNLGGTFHRLVGTQDPVTNSGAAVTAVTIGPRDMVILARTSQLAAFAYVDPAKTATGVGTLANPYNPTQGLAIGPAASGDRVIMWLPGDCNLTTANADIRMGTLLMQSGAGPTRRVIHRAQFPGSTNPATWTRLRRASGVGVIFGFLNNSWSVWDGFRCDTRAGGGLTTPAHGEVGQASAWGSTNCAFLRCYFDSLYDTYTAGDRNCIFIQGCQGIEIADSIFKKINTQGQSTFSNVTLLMWYNSSGIRVHHCEFSEAPTAIWAKGQTDPGTVFDHDYYSNVFFDCGVAVRITSPIQTDPLRFLRVYRNLIRGCQFPLVVGQVAQPNEPAGIVYANNTVVNGVTRDAGALGVSSGGFIAGGQSNAFIDGTIIVRNNIYFNVSVANWLGDTSSVYDELRWDYNLYSSVTTVCQKGEGGPTENFATWSGVGHTPRRDQNGSTANPLFVNNASDWKLQAGSPARLAATDYLNLLGGGTSAPINMGAYITSDMTDQIGPRL